MATPHIMQQPVYAAGRDGARCWENAFQAFGSAKFFWGKTQTPRMGFATSVLAGSVSTRHGLPPSQKS